MQMPEEEFEKLVSEGIEAIPKHFLDKLTNVAFVIADKPTEAQRAKMHLDPHSTLLGLYEGVPLTERGEYYSFVAPDKITIFRLPSLEMAHSPEEVREIVKNTVWHEIAHYFGMDEHEVREREHDEGRDKY